MRERRQVLRGVAAATSMALAGCPLGDEGGSGGEGTPREVVFVDDCNDTTQLADGSDVDVLGPDTTNVENFERVDGSIDDARLNRAGTTEDAALAYAPEGDLVDARAEFHWHEDAGGDVAVQESTDGGDTWSDASVERTEYGGVDNAWMHAELLTEFFEGVDQVRYVLTGGSEPWSGQIGHVTISVLTTASDLATPTTTPEPTPVPLGTTVDGSAEDVVFDEFVETDGSDFVVDGAPLSVSGGNHPQVSRLDGGLTAEEWLSAWTDLAPDLNVMRVPAFGEGQANYLQPAPGEYNEQAFRLLDRVIYRFGVHGVRLVMPLSNYWNWRGGIPQYVEWSNEASSKADFYTDDQTTQWFREFVETLLERENSVTGVKYKNDPTIMLWELGNEPRAGSADYETYHEWTRETAEFIKSVDSNHLVSTGMEGFYGPYGPVGHDETRYVETHQVDAIDACSFHLYPEAWGLTIEQGTEWIRTHTEEANEKIGKPSYLGEFGVAVDRLRDAVDEQLAHRNDVYETWYDALVEAETDGAMVWDLRTESEYASTSSWNEHAVYPRDERTVQLIDEYSAKITGLAGGADSQ